MNREPRPLRPAPGDSVPARILLGRRLAAVAGVFLLVVAGLMALNSHLLRTADPLDSPALRALTEQLARDRDNETLRRQVRELDLLARRAFFVRQWQIETGAALLAVAGVVFVVALFLMTGGRPRAPDLSSCPGLDPPAAAAARARRIVAITGLALLMFSMAAALLARRQARLPGEEPPTSMAATPPDEPLTRPPRPGAYWPAFRGPRSLGVAPPEADPPTNWDGPSGAGIRWASVVPRPGASSPVVWGNRVFLTGADETAREVYAFDTDTGELLWRADTAGLDDTPDALPDVLPDTGHAAPSPAVYGQRVVALFSTGAILGLDADGRRLWGRRLGTPDNHYGHASSLLIYRDMVYVQYDHFGGSALIALDLETGRPRWTRMRDADTSWASPVLVEHGGRMLLVLQAAPMVAAYDALSGEEVWRNECMSGEIGSSPAYAAGRVFAANQHAQAVALDASGGELLWASRRLELPDAGSPVATDRFLFLPTSHGAFSCVNAADGTLLWEHDFDTGGYGSPVLAGDRIYWVTSDGRTRIFRAAETFERIAEPALGEPSHGTPAVVGQRLYIRGTQHLFCVGNGE